MTWQERVRQRMKELDMPHGSLASMIGVKASRLSNWLSGNRDPDIAYFADMVRALDVSADWILFGEKRQMNWMDQLDDRQQALIRDCIRYSEGDAAGLPGHNLLLLVAKLSDLLDTGYGKMVAVRPPPIDPTKPVDLSNKPPLASLK